MQSATSDGVVLASTSIPPTLKRDPVEYANDAPSHSGHPHSLNRAVSTSTSLVRQCMPEPDMFGYNRRR